MVGKIKHKDVALQRQYYGKIASSYDNATLKINDEHYVALNFIYSFVNMLHIKNVLDVGCGTGRGVKYFYEKGIAVSGIEPVEAMIEVAINSNGIPSDLLMCASGESLPFVDGAFDSVCEFGILHHVAEPNYVVKEMIRVAKKAVFLSDCNRFGQGRIIERIIKLVSYKMKLWKLINLIKTGGKGYMYDEEGDGLAYSYSIFDSYDILAEWADKIILIPTKNDKMNSWVHPLLTSSHILLCAIRERDR